MKSSTCSAPWDFLLPFPFFLYSHITSCIRDSLHFVRRSAPSKCVRCASLRSGGRRLAVRKTIEYQIGALPRTPFPAAREFPSRGNERYEEKNRGVICFMYYSSISPFATTFPPHWEACHWILSRLRLLANPVPLPPQAGAQ